MRVSSEQRDTERDRGEDEPRFSETFTGGIVALNRAGADVLRAERLAFDRWRADAMAAGTVPIPEK